MEPGASSGFGIKPASSCNIWAMPWNNLQATSANLHLCCYRSLDVTAKINWRRCTMTEPKTTIECSFLLLLNKWVTFAAKWYVIIRGEILERMQTAVAKLLPLLGRASGLGKFGNRTSWPERGEPSILSPWKQVDISSPEKDRKWGTVFLMKALLPLYEQRFFALNSWEAQ